MNLRGGPKCSGRNKRRKIFASTWRQAIDFLTESRGATAIEFALISPMLLLTILFLMSIGYMILMNQLLDFATSKAARLIRTGQTQAAGITSSQAFVTQQFCALLPSLFNCNNIIVYTQTFPSNISTSSKYPTNVYSSYINTSNNGLVVPPLNTNNTFCPGAASTYVFLQVLYPVNIFLAMISSSSVATIYNGQKYYMIMSTAVFLNEPFSATSPC